MVKRHQINSSMASALRLQAAAGVERLILMTDSARLDDPARAIKRLPSGSIVILRDYDHADRLALAKKIRDVCRVAGCWFLVAGDASLGRQVGADGLHLPEHMLSGEQFNRGDFHIITAACHSRRALRLAHTMGVDLALVSPVFETASGAEKTPLGVHRLARLIAGAQIPVAALGGVNHRTAKHLYGLKIVAIAAISAF